MEQAELLAGHLARIDKQVIATAAACRYAQVIDALMCLRGIQLTTAFGLAVEIGDWTRFTGSSIGSYLWLVLSEEILWPGPAPGPDHQSRQHLRPQTPHRSRLAAPAPLCTARRTTRIRPLEGHHRLHHNGNTLMNATRCQ